MSLRSQAKISLLALAMALSMSAQAGAQTPDDGPIGSQVGAPTAIQAQELSQLDTWAVGAISRSQGALPQTLWSQSNPAVAEALFARLPSKYESPSAQALARRVLLSGGTAPRGDADAAARGRFEALAKMGAADELAIMAAGVGPSDLAIGQFAAQAELARGRISQACTRARGIDTLEPTAFMLQLRALCSAVSGDRAAADLALELASAQGASDAWISAATSAAGGAPGRRAPEARYTNSLTTQLSLSGNLTPGANPLADASALALVALARSDAAAAPLRAQAAELAYRRGSLSIAETQQILRAIPAEVADGLPPLAIALRRIDSARASAAAEAEARAAEIAARQQMIAAGAAPESLAPPPAPSNGPELAIAGAIVEVLRGVSSPADLAAASNFFKDEIARLTTAPDPGAAVILARAAVVTGDVALGQRLVDSLAQAGVEAAALAPLQAALALYGGPNGNQAAMAVTRRIDAGGASMAQAAARDVAIMSAAGFPLDGAAQQFLLANPPQGGARADPGLMALLRAAQARGALGEALLIVAISIGDGPARLDTDSASQLIGALRGLGLEDEARRLAIETLLAGQPG